MNQLKDLKDFSLLKFLIFANFLTLQYLSFF
jgi:hypothetical protein